METNWKTLNDLASRQHGLLTRAQLTELEVSERTRRTLVKIGRLKLLGCRTYGVGGSPPTDHRRVLLACLDTGGVATQRAAAWVHGFGCGFRPGALPAVVVGRRRYDYRSPVAEVHTSTWLPPEDLAIESGVPTLSVARTLFSLAGAAQVVSPSVVADAVDIAVRDGKASDQWLWWMLERTRRRGRNGVLVFEAILASRAGGAVTESWLEREFLRLLREAGVELPACQRRVDHEGAFVARVDFLYAALKLVIEVSGHGTHSTKRQREEDTRRRNELTLAGYRFIEFTYDRIVSDPTGVVAEVIAARAAPGTVAA